jgi:hypothetical protein
MPGHITSGKPRHGGGAANQSATRSWTDRSGLQQRPHRRRRLEEQRRHGAQGGDGHGEDDEADAHPQIEQQLRHHERRLPQACQR